MQYTYTAIFVMNVLNLKAKIYNFFQYNTPKRSLCNILNTTLKKQLIDKIKDIQKKLNWNIGKHFIRRTNTIHTRYQQLKIV